jgi:hypothetical protein
MGDPCLPEFCWEFPNGFREIHLCQPQGLVKAECAKLLSKIESVFGFISVSILNVWMLFQGWIFLEYGVFSEKLFPIIKLT